MEPPLKYPKIRDNLIFYTKELADERIGDLWASKNSDSNGSENIEYIIHFFFDDTSFSEDPLGYIGIALKDEEEAVAVKRLINSLDTLFDLYGTDLADRDYLEKREWKAVSKYANELLLLLKK